MGLPVLHRRPPKVMIPYILPWCRGKNVFISGHLNICSHVCRFETMRRRMHTCQKKKSERRQWASKSALEMLEILPRIEYRMKIQGKEYHDPFMGNMSTRARGRSGFVIFTRYTGHQFIAGSYSTLQEGASFSLNHVDMKNGCWRRANSPQPNHQIKTRHASCSGRHRAQGSTQ
jgi:hypothetical protein